jgi:ribosomal protein L24E
MKRLLTVALLPALVWAVATSIAADKEKTDPRAALAPFNDYIGSWQGDGKAKKGGNWTETLEWGWKFKGDDAWLIFKAKDGKFLKTGEIRYVPDKKEFAFSGVDVNDKKISLQGAIDEKGYLTLLGTDPATKEQLKFVMFIAGDGIFFNYRYSHAKEGAKLFVIDYEMKAKKDGEVFKAGSKQPVCCVSGGLGTMAVTFKGSTYYVCCSGCRDAFNENPEKWVKEFEAKKKK